MLLPLDGKLIIIWPPGDKFMLLILPPGGQLIIPDQVSGRITYASLFGLRAVSLCFSFCSGVRPDSLCFFIGHPGGKFVLLYSASGREPYFTR